MAIDPRALDDRVQSLVERYDQAEGICLADLLCDSHNLANAAYRLMRGIDAQDISYGELKHRSERVAAALLANGVGPGARIATLMRKSVDLLATLLGIWRIGGVHVPLFTAFATEGIALRLAGSAADAVFCDAGQRAKLDSETLNAAGKDVLLVTRGDVVAGDKAIAWDAFCATGVPAAAPHVYRSDDPMICIFTSGTTGNPKGVQLPVKGLASIHAYAEFGLGITADDIYWCAADPGWAYGLYYAVVAPLLLGQRAILAEGGFDAETTLAILQQEKVTNFAAAPTVYRALRANGAAAGKLAVAKLSSAGEPLTADLNDWAPSALGSVIYDHFGQTEAGMIVNNHHHPLLRDDPRIGSMGVAMPGWEVRILDEATYEVMGPDELGLLAVDMERSPLAWFGGYLSDTEKSAAKFSPDGRWYLTGDMARMDREGRVYFTSRADDVILMAGYRIGPFEIETVLNAHPAVRNSAAVGLPDELRGERLEACVLLAEDIAGTEALAKELQNWVKTRYAAHAYPRQIHFVEELPMTPSGKIQRHLVRQSLM